MEYLYNYIYLILFILGLKCNNNEGEGVMLQKLKKTLLNPWIIAILSPIITTSIVAIVKDINFIEGIKYILSVIKVILDYKISVKVIALIVIILCIVLKIYVVISELKEEHNPKWLSYTKDAYKEWYFKWEYSKYYSEYDIKNIRPICECGCGLNYKHRHHDRYYSNGVLVCPKCDNSYNSVNNEIINDFKAILYHNIETNNYNIVNEIR